MKKLIFIFISLMLIIPLRGQNLNSIKREIQSSIENQKDNLIKTSDAIWEAAETSLEEFTS